MHPGELATVEYELVNTAEETKAGQAIPSYAPEIGGRYFYNADVTALNFDASRVALDEYLDRILAHLEDAAPPSFYVGSTDVEHYLPGLREKDGLVLNDPMFDANPPMVGIWIDFTPPGAPAALGQVIIHRNHPTVALLLRSRWHLACLAPGHLR